MTFLFSALPSKTMQTQVFSLLLIFLGLASADYLQNPDFETSPKDLPGNSSVPFLLLSENNTIPGWTFEGTVKYITAIQNISLPDNGHALQLGQDGQINQTFTANADDMNYLLTFSLASGGQNCSTNAEIVVSSPNSQAAFSFKQHYGKEAWQSYGQYLGLWGQEEPMNLVFQSQAADSDATNSTCWPVIDTLLIKTVGTLVQGNDNLLLTGGLEVGSEFLSNSTEGILLDPAACSRH